MFDCGCCQEVGRQGFRRNNKREEEMRFFGKDSDFERFVKAFINRSDTRFEQLSAKLASVDGIIREVETRTGSRWPKPEKVESVRNTVVAKKRKYTKRSKFWKKAAAVVLLSGLALGSASAQSIYNPYATNVYNPFNPAPVVPEPVLNPPVDVIGR